MRPFDGLQARLYFYEVVANPSPDLTGPKILEAAIRFLMGRVRRLGVFPITLTSGD